MLSTIVLFKIAAGYYVTARLMDRCIDSIHNSNRLACNELQYGDFKGFLQDHLHVVRSEDLLDMYKKYNEEKYRIVQVGRSLPGASFFGFGVSDATYDLVTNAHHYSGQQLAEKVIDYMTTHTERGFCKYLTKNVGTLIMANNSSVNVSISVEENDSQQQCMNA